MLIDKIKNIIDIDGSYGSGGGQILRTALALSILTGKPFRLKNIRAKRKNPGLQHQHLACVKAAEQLCNAETQGAELESKELLFFPSLPSAKQFDINIGTAGSIPLVLQTLMPALLLTDNINIRIRGGTDVSFAPPIDYTKNIFLRLLSKIGYDATIEIIKRGFYPKGGGEVIFKLNSINLKYYDFTEKGKMLAIKGISVASSDLKPAKVAERQANHAKKWLMRNDLFKNLSINIQHQYAEALSPGSILVLWLETEKSVLGSSSLGQRGKPAEVVAREAAQQLSNEIYGSVDSHAADQLLPFMAWFTYKASKTTSLKTSRITEHARTNAFTIQKFLPVKFDIDESRGMITIKNQNS